MGPGSVGETGSTLRGSFESQIQSQHLQHVLTKSRKQVAAMTVAKLFASGFCLARTSTDPSLCNSVTSPTRTSSTTRYEIMSGDFHLDFYALGRVCFLELNLKICIFQKTPDLVFDFKLTLRGLCNFQIIPN